MMEADFELLKDTPGFKNILKAILKNQLKQIVKSLSVYGGEETILISTSLSDGAIHHLGSPSTTGFLDNKDDLKLQFLGHCLQNSHKSKKEYSRSADIIRDTQTSRANVEHASPSITKIPESFTSHVVASGETPKVGRKRGRPKGKVSVPTAIGSNVVITGEATGQKRPSETETSESLMKRRNVSGSISESHEDSASEINEEGTCTLKLEVEHSDLQTAGNLTSDSSSLADNFSRGTGAIETHGESEKTHDKRDLTSSTVTNNIDDSNDTGGVTVKLEPPDDDNDVEDEDDFDGDSDDETWTPESETPRQSVNNPSRSEPPNYTGRSEPPNYTDRGEQPNYTGKNVMQNYTDKNMMPNYTSRNEKPNYTGRSEMPDYTGRNVMPNYTGKNVMPNYTDRNEPPNYTGKNMMPNYTGRNMKPNYTGRNEMPNYTRMNVPPNHTSRNELPNYTGRNQLPFTDKNQPSNYTCRNEPPNYTGRNEPPNYTGRNESQNCNEHSTLAQEVEFVQHSTNRMLNQVQPQQAKLESIAKNRREYSKAARRLLCLMFTEEEREGRCLIDHRRRSKTTGEIVIKQGLEDQDKLQALQDIILHCFPLVSRTDINRQLAHKLKPSATTPKDYNKNNSVKEG